MTNIIYLLVTRQLISIFLAIFAFLSMVIAHPPCGLYGAPPCQFLPAPPGQTPACTRPGKTYCEHVDNYPTYLIKHLVHKWGYESKNLIVDETWDEFEALSWDHSDTQKFYDPALIFPQHHFGPSDFSGYKYDTPDNAHAEKVRGAGEVGVGNEYPNSISMPPKPQDQEQASYLIYGSSGQRSNYNKKKLSIIYNHGYNGDGTKVTPNNPSSWLKRFVRDLSRKAFGTSLAETNRTTATFQNSRDISINMDFLDTVGVRKQSDSNQHESLSRVKRQSPGRSVLCQTSSQFITPQAALNSKGNWMFVVNEQNTARQLVKTELCTSTNCANLCQLPNGYTSRCEQKFVQKRLIALQGSGQNLYTDTFWFPSCCVCTISN